MVANVAEGFRAKRAYITFWADFHFCGIELVFGGLTCFGVRGIAVWLFLLICASFSRNNVCKKLSFPRFLLEIFC